jgi:hypothetical protein
VTGADRVPVGLDLLEKTGPAQLLDDLPPRLHHVHPGEGRPRLRAHPAVAVDHRQTGRPCRYPIF